MRRSNARRDRIKNGEPFAEGMILAHYPFEQELLASGRFDPPKVAIKEEIRQLDDRMVAEFSESEAPDDE